VKLIRVILIVLLLICCSLWVASYWKLWWVSSDGPLAIGLWNGSFIFDRTVSDFSVSGLFITGFDDLETHWWPVVGITTSPEFWMLKGTFWLPTLLLALPLAISASPWARRRRRAKQGLCIRCGYDLSGASHTLCPECGTEVVRA